jgi:hypothetical protein
MNATLFNKLPLFVLQNLLVESLKERRFSQALELLQLCPTLATTEFVKSQVYSCLEELLQYLCEEPNFNIEDETFMKIMIFPFGEEPSELDLTNRQLRLLHLIGVIRSAGKSSSILNRIIAKCWVVTKATTFVPRKVKC